MKKQLLVIALCITLMAQAQNIFQDDFSSYSTLQQLSGQGPWTNNSSNPGGLGAAVTGSGGVNAVVIDQPVYAQYYGDSPNSFQIQPNSDGCGRAFPAVTSGDLYVGFVLNLSAAQANNNSDFFRVMSGDNFNTSFRIYAVNTGFVYNLGICKGANGNPITFTATGLAYGENNLVIIKYTQGAGTADDVLSAYINSNYQLGQPASPTISTTSGTDQAGNIDRLSFRQNWTNGMPTGRVGLVSVSTTWAGLGFLPLATTTFSNADLFVDGTQAKSGILTISSQTKMENASLKIYSVSGVSVYSGYVSLNDSKNTLAISPIQANGVYILEITDADTQKKYVQKMVVR